MVYNSKKKTSIIELLISKGFTGDFKLFYWAKDGWYLHCDQCQHDWLGQNYMCALENIRKDEFSHLPIAEKLPHLTPPLKTD